MVVAGLEGEEAGEPVESAVDEVEIQMVRQGSAAVGACRRVEQFADVGDVVARHLALDLETTHASRVPAAGQGS